MANKTLLDAVNEVLKRVNVIDASNVGLLTSLTQSALQHNIDVAVQVVNEGMDELYSTAEVELPLSGAESTVVIVTNQREYSLPSNLVTMRWPMIDRVNTQYISQWKDSYESFLLIDPNQNMTGLPLWGIISPITGKLRFEFAPQSSLNGNTYTFEYEKDVSVSLATDTVPFNNEVFRAMVPAWVQLYKREMRNEFDQSLFQQAIGRASRTITQEPMKIHYSPRG